MYSSFEDLKLFKNLIIPRFVETAETPRCLFCQALYTSEREVRAEITCPACQGKGDLARKIEILTVVELERARKLGDCTRIRAVMELFPNSYFSEQCRLALMTIGEMQSVVAVVGR